MSLNFRAQNDWAKNFSTKTVWESTDLTPTNKKGRLRQKRHFNDTILFFTLHVVSNVHCTALNWVIESLDIDFREIYEI